MMPIWCWESATQKGGQNQKDCLVLPGFHEACAWQADQAPPFVQTAPDEVFPGDPARAAKVLIQVVESEQGSRRIIFGSDAFSTITSNCKLFKPNTKPGSPSPSVRTSSQSRTFQNERQSRDDSTNVDSSPRINSRRMN